MTEIIEGNKLIAEFMGKTIYPVRGTKEFTKWKGSPCDYEWFEVKYHSSWDWLMPVVENINDIDNQATISDAKALELFKKEHEGEGNNIFETSIFCHIGEVFNRVVEFIKWYNQIDR